MQPAAARRAFSILASKIHPQLPLTPRESQQLLHLLTTSFRRQLDREHPIHAPDFGPHRSRSIPTSSPCPSESPRGPRPTSHGLATQHIDSILRNPLFAVRPARRSSDVLKVGDARHILKDPLAWFLDEVASGSADLTKAAICLEMLTNAPSASEVPAPSQRGSPSGVIAGWLDSIDQQSWDAFIANKKLVRRLTHLLMREGKEDVLWRWFKYKHRQCGISSQVKTFRGHLLAGMVNEQLDGQGSLDSALDTFFQAVVLVNSPTFICSASRVEILPAGVAIALHLLRNTKVSPESTRYEMFLQQLETSTQGLNRVFPALLRLQHPTSPDAGPGLQLLRSHNDRVLSDTARTLYIQLALDVARQLLSEQKFSDAQWVLDFSKTMFPELLSPTSSSKDAKRLRDGRGRDRELDRVEAERQSMSLLDKLAPA